MGKHNYLNYLKEIKSEEEFIQELDTIINIYMSEFSDSQVKKEMIEKLKLAVNVVKVS
ncbi:hypothetical protein LGQ02_16475 [Bacillus shivajii]|uniref:hypothetical protein n=1 Tax=Bacillus shivajii TaxID=1983719 RepID=UPI001CFA3F44|nr:hypothetical protein [Bacillus shivajii]UCZ52419.1 hypothetical protein LGQ02_16475 [Bacillus shivajii]